MDVALGKEDSGANCSGELLHSGAIRARSEPPQGVREPEDDSDRAPALKKESLEIMLLILIKK
jgi:hypothetical protein